ncbi:hypothetical protein OIU74_023438 [Salix koriyanagi]|uniref:Uncharacterized protein n=1 Tax=Salix koriyanagi TaxID=2511006 RepID=A0A9Q1AAS5_9ROSI|nr:hypothetical protein OIU74_023438 [Salix koriyanagi]
MVGASKFFSYRYWSKRASKIEATFPPLEFYINKNALISGNVFSEKELRHSFVYFTCRCSAPDCLRSAETSRHSTGLRRPIPLLETRSLLPELLKIEVHKVEDLEQRRRPDLIYEGFPQVIAERDSLKDQLSEANRKIADLENMARAFQIRQLEDELAKKAEENQWLKSQLDRKREGICQAEE